MMGCSQLGSSIVRPVLGATTTPPGPGTPISATLIIPASSRFFGLTVLDYQNFAPELTFGESAGCLHLWTDASMGIHTSRGPGALWSRSMCSANHVRMGSIRY